MLQVNVVQVLALYVLANSTPAKTGQGVGVVTRESIAAGPCFRAFEGHRLPADNTNSNRAPIP